MPTYVKPKLRKVPFSVRRGVYMSGKPHCRLVAWNPDVKTDYVADPKRVKRILKEQKV